MGWGQAGWAQGVREVRSQAQAQGLLCLVSLEVRQKQPSEGVTTETRIRFQNRGQKRLSDLLKMTQLIRKW